jgi:hypothetical protein
MRRNPTFTPVADSFQGKNPDCWTVRKKKGRGVKNIIVCAAVFRLDRAVPMRCLARIALAREEEHASGVIEGGFAS